jgi:hypothetical protein
MLGTLADLSGMSSKMTELLSVLGRRRRSGTGRFKQTVIFTRFYDTLTDIVDCLLRYGRLLHRLAEVGAMVGTQQLSLLPVTREEFQQLADKTLSEGELERRATERARLARRRTASMEMPPEELYATYLRLEQQQAQTHIPVDLDTIWSTFAQSAYLRALGGRVMPDEDQQIMELANIPALLDGTAVTTSRPTFDVGVSALEGRLHFATYGDPAFEAVLAQVGTFELPPLLVWVTKTMTTTSRGDAALAPSSVKLLLDGQQRITSLYGIMQGKPPQFFDGNEQAFTGLYFNLEDEIFEFYGPLKMDEG